MLSPTRLHHLLLAGLLTTVPSFGWAQEAEKCEDCAESDSTSEVVAENIADWSTADDDVERGEQDLESTGESAPVVETTIASASSSPDELEGLESNQKVKITLLKIKNWPEFKVENKTQCRRIFGRRVCIDVPQAFQRNSELIAYAEVTHPDARSLKSKIEDCVRVAVAGGVVAGVYTGNLPAAAAALKVSLKACLAARGAEAVNRLGVTVRTETKSGPWRPR